MKKKLNAYRGRLTPGQIAAGMNAAARNARRLSEDAEALVATGRFPTAASVAALSVEEAGKVSILRELALAKTDAEALEVWKRYRSHTSKNVAWLLPQLAAAGARKLEDLRGLFDETSDHPFVLDNLKQLGFYTDCLGKGHWALPWEVIDEGLARMLVQIAKALSGKDQHTEREIALWMDHIGPVWKKDVALMKQALVNWYSAMQTEGLAAEGANAMEQFIRERVQEKAG